MKRRAVSTARLTPLYERDKDRGNGKGVGGKMRSGRLVVQPGQLLYTARDAAVSRDPVSLE